eukprot:TRINITY_DN62120_c0_g1_i1.p1 TRINITY_DN62120_c0_g1~~TRINITY_DN62120_c0_g1_i1.p1  ORF type:complete len:712 (-),score=126.29 TRINITY_DN62120_c0_g1_i1:87-2222(-)
MQNRFASDLQDLDEIGDLDQALGSEVYTFRTPANDANAEGPRERPHCDIFEGQEGSDWDSRPGAGVAGSDRPGSKQSSRKLSKQGVIISECGENELDASQRVLGEGGTDDCGPPGCLADGGSKNEDVPESPAATASAAQFLRDASSQLMDNLDAMTRRHRLETTGYLEQWRRRLEAVEVAEFSKLETTASASTNPKLSKSRTSMSVSEQFGLGGVWTLPRAFTTHPASNGVASDRNSPRQSAVGELSIVPLAEGTSENGNEKDGLMENVETPVTPSGKSKKTRRVKKILGRSADEMLDDAFLQRIVRHPLYEFFSGALIVINAVFIGVQCEFLASRADQEAIAGQPLTMTEPPIFFGFQVVFCIAFTIELGLRWAASGLLNFFLLAGDDLGWNVGDVLIVGFSIFNLVLEIFAAGAGGNFSVLRVLRVVRVVRIARVIRVLRFFRELRMMIFSILGSMKNLMWVILCLFLTFYVFGIAFVSAVTAFLETTEMRNEERFKPLVDHYGTLRRAILTLFMSMSGGNDWGMYFDALAPLPAVNSIMYLLFITFSVFAVVNIVTGVFVESALQSNSNDADILVQEELNAKKAYLDSMKTLFEEMDEDGTGVISYEEFEKRLEDERVEAYFSALKLDVSEARMLFQLLDYDQSMCIEYEEFVSGCWKLQGEARALDAKMMQYEVRFLKEAVLVMSEDLKFLKDSMDGQTKQKTGSAE